MKPSRILALIGGLLAGVAFFLPIFSFFGFSISGFDIVRSTTNEVGDLSNQAFLYWLQPIAAIALIVFALLAANMGKAAHGINLVAALVGIGVLIYVFVRIQSSLSGSTFSGASAASFLGIGFWIAAAAFILGLVGAIMGLAEAPKAAPVIFASPPQGNWPQQ